MAESVSVGHVDKVFRTGGTTLPVLERVQLEVAAGEFVAVLGPSGCGKSTLLRLVAGLDRPTAGAVRLGGRLVEDVDSRCAVVFQEPRLFPWKTVAANVAVGTRRRPGLPTPAAMLGLVGLTGFGNVYPHQLSGGMAQRTALARALIGRPEVLLLDEPFASLDALTRLQMQDLLADACQAFRPTVVMVTHDVDEALSLADRIVLMSRRPATITTAIAVPGGRPRDRGAAPLRSLRTEILAHFGLARTATGERAGAGPLGRGEGDGGEAVGDDVVGDATNLLGDPGAWRTAGAAPDGSGRRRAGEEAGRDPARLRLLQPEQPGPP